MIKVSATGPLLAAALLSTSCGRPLSDSECYAMLDHYTELLVKAQTPKTPASRIAELQQQARALAQNDPVYEFSSCSKKVNRRNFECAMKAPTADELERCLIF